MISHYSIKKFKQFYLFSVIFFASFINTELLSLRGRRSVDDIDGFASHYFHIGIFVFVVAPVLVVSWITFMKRQKKKEKMREEYFEQNGGNLLQRKLDRNRNIQLKMYTAEEMNLITSTYNTERVELRDCNPGVFYRGTLLPEDDDDDDDDDDSKAPEVSVVMIARVPGSQINRFVDQLIWLSQQRMNMVRIIGCCLEKESPLIVYQLGGDGNATLSDCILYRDPCFSCAMRVKAAAGVARGLAYMNSHKTSRTTFVHGNICRANILLDNSYSAMIFYSAGSNLHLITEDMDTTSSVYYDPEFIRTRCLNKKSDVYSFGVLLVELLIREEIKNRHAALEIINLAKVGRLREILDTNMIGEGDVEVVRELAELAEKCLSLRPGQRPIMKEVAAKIRVLMQRNYQINEF